jgi:phenylacetate-CoA ligase
LVYLKWRYNINKTEYLDKDSLRDFQLQKIKELLTHSYLNIPHYKNLFKNNNIHPSDINSFEDFRKIPFLTKEEIRANPLKFISDKVENKNLYFYTTGGSTGQPLRFYRNPKMDAIEEAFMFHQWGRIGFKESSKRVILRGEPLKNNLLFFYYCC